jgi:hypothetical protein
MIEWLVVGGLMVSMLAAAEIGFRLGCRSKLGADDRSQVGVLQGAMLGLLGLLLGFAFSGATSRFMERQQVIVAEANAMGTAYLRADLLPAEAAEGLRAELRRYAEKRIELFREVDPAAAARLDREMGEMHPKLWYVARAGVAAKPEVIMAVLPPVNEVIDLLAKRNAMTRMHMPGLVVVVLIAAAGIAMATIGYGSGLVKRRPRVLTLCFAALIALVMWITIDLDYPRAGMIRMSEQPLVDARAAMGK